MRHCSWTWFDSFLIINIRVVGGTVNRTETANWCFWPINRKLGSKTGEKTLCVIEWLRHLISCMGLVSSPKLKSWLVLFYFQKLIDLFYTYFTLEIFFNIRKKWKNKSKFPVESYNFQNFRLRRRNGRNLAPWPLKILKIFACGAELFAMISKKISLCDHLFLFFLHPINVLLLGRVKTCKCIFCMRICHELKRSKMVFLHRYFH